MKKSAVLLLTAVFIVSLLFIPAASAGNVSVTFSGEQNVKPGQTYSYNYTLFANDCYETQIVFLCNNSRLSGDTKILYTNPIFGNSNYSINGILYLEVNETANTGDVIKITTSGRYSIVNDEGIPNLGGCISESYTLTVVSDEESTPIPTSAPTQSIPSQTAMPVPSSSTEAEVKPAPKPAAHPSVKPSNSISDAETSQINTSSALSDELLTTAQTLQSTAVNDMSSLSSQLDLMSKGGTVIVSMDPFTDSTLSALTLRVLKAKQGKMIIDYDDYSCIINGDKLAATIDSSVNLYMDMTTNQKISEAAAGHDLYQMHFSESSDFPGCMIYEISTVKNQPGDVLYLYQHHTTSGINEYKQNVTVDDNGHASFEIYEGGSYFVSSSLVNDNPKTGDNPVQASTGTELLYIIIPISCAILAAAVIFAALTIKKAMNKKGSVNN